MKIYGIIGWKNAGKTSLVERLVAEITGRGFGVSTVKHVHHDVDLDQPGKDTFRHRQAGAAEVVLAGARRFAILREHRGAEPPLADVLARLAPVDLVLVEGYKRDGHPKVEVFREGEGRRPIAPGDPTVRAVATDAPGAIPAGVPVLDLNDTGAVADFILRETGLMAGGVFDRVIVVDWSSANAPSPARESADAIWIGTADARGETATYLRTRHAAEAWLMQALALPGRSLIGFDFPMGYPAGFAERLTGRRSAAAVWAWLAERITDSAANANNRFAVAAEINARVGPLFWGRPARDDLPDLPTTKAVDPGALNLAERRTVEARHVRKAQPVWKLYTTGAVGAQALTGLPLIHRLSQRDGVAVWPFQPVADARVVLAEVYPGVIDGPVRAEIARAGGVKDRVQVTLLARALFRLPPAELSRLMETPPEAAEEGWILGAQDPQALVRCIS